MQTTDWRENLAGINKWHSLFVEYKSGHINKSVDIDNKLNHMNSCLYKCTVMHHRLEPKRNKFSYGIFMFYLDLDEIEVVAKKLKLIGHNVFNLFSFWDKDHAKFPGQTKEGSSAKEKITEFIAQHGVNIGKGKITLLTNLTTLGYVFNPVSFYFCFDEKGNPVCAVAQVCNTFGEMKMYFIAKEKLSDKTFDLYTQKHFYVSPYAKLDTHFNFILKVPEDQIVIRVDDYQEERRFLLTTLTGEKKTLSDRNLLYYFIGFPFITLQVITLIHWQALILYFKKIPYIRKKDNIQLQKDLIKL